MIPENCDPRGLINFSVVSLYSDAVFLYGLDSSKDSSKDPSKDSSKVESKVESKVVESKVKVNETSTKISKAILKVEEAFMGRGWEVGGGIWVDVGASPGSWTKWVVDNGNGVKVVAIDQGDLNEEGEGRGWRTRSESDECDMRSCALYRCFRLCYASLTYMSRFHHCSSQF